MCNDVVLLLESRTGKNVPVWCVLDGGHDSVHEGRLDFVSSLALMVYWDRDNDNIHVITAGSRVIVASV